MPILGLHLQPINTSPCLPTKRWAIHEDALTRQRRMRVKCTRETCLISIWESVAMNSNKENDCTQGYTQDFWLAGVNMAPVKLNSLRSVLTTFLVIMASRVTFVVTKFTNKTCHESMTIGEVMPHAPCLPKYAVDCTRRTAVSVSRSYLCLLVSWCIERYYRGTVHHYSFTLSGESALKGGVINPVCY